MAAAAGIKAGLAYVEMALNDAKFRQGLSAVEGRLKAFASGMLSIGTQLGGLSVAMAAPLALATNTFMGFEKSMSRVKALTGATEAEFRALTAEAKRLGETTEYSSSQMADTMAALAQRGFSVNNILKSTGPVMRLAATGNIELARAAEIASDAMGAMGIPAEELASFVDVMAYASTKSASSVEQLGDAFRVAGPNAKKMGMSVEDFAASLMVLADAGYKGEYGATALRGLFETIQLPQGNEARDMLAELGVQVDDGTGKFRKFDEIVGQFVGSLSKLSQVEKSRALGVIFPNRQTGAIDILTRPDDKTGVTPDEKIRQKLQGIKTEAPGSAEKISTIQLDNLWGAWKLIESAIEGVAITIGETLAPTIREWASATIHGIGLLHNIVKENKDWIPVIAKTAVVIGGIGAALFAVGAAVSVAGFAFSGLATAVSAVAGLAGAVFSPVILGVAAAVGLVIAAVSELGLTWEGMTPILKAWGGYVAVVAAVAVGAVMWVASIVKVIGSEFGKAFKIIGKWLSETFPRQMNSLGETVSSIAKRFAGFFDDLTATFNKSWGGIVDAIKAGDLTLAAEVAMAGFKVAWKQGEVFLIGSWRDTLAFFHDKWVDTWRSISLGINGIWYSIEKALFEGFAAVYRGWGWLMDSMKRQMAGTSAAWTTMAAGLKAGVTFDLNFQKSIEAAAAKAQSDLKDELDAIKAAREAEINKELTGRKDIDNRKGAAEGRINSAADERKQAFGRETGNQLEGPIRELADAQKELTDAINKARISLVASNSGMYAGGLAGLKAMEGLKDLTPEAIVARANQATGGSGAGSGASAGTFDSSVARLLGGTNNAEMQLAQLRQQLETQRQSKELLAHVIKILDDIRREGGALFK